MRLHGPYDKSTRVLFSITIIFIVFSLFIISNIPPAKGYEFFIYNAYPWYFWFFIALSLLIGQLIILKSAVSENESNSWAFGFITILITDAILLLLPMVRGYLIYGRGDVLTHVGYAKDILNSGHISPSNIYPVEHILAVTIHGITNMDIETLTIVIPVILFFLFVFWYALFIFLVLGKKVLLFVLPISALPLFGTKTIFYVPNVLSFYFMPFILCIFYILLNSGLKREKIKYKYMAILFLATICVSFFHPITFLYLIITVLLLLYTIEIAPNKYYKKKSYSPFYIKFGIIFLLGLFLVSYVIYLSNPIFKSGLNRLVSNFFGLNPPLSRYVYTLKEFDISIVDIIKVLISKFGTLFILAVLSTILIAYYLIKYFRKDNFTKEKIKSLFSPHYRYLIFFIMGFVSFSTWGLLNMFIHFLYFHRTFKLIIFFSIPITGFLFYICNKKYKKYKKTKFIFIIGVLALLACTSIIGLFNSRWTGEQNCQISHGEYVGMHWFLEYRDNRFLIYEQGPPQFRFHDAIYGTADKTHSKNIRSSSTRIPDHFGYHKNVELTGQLYDKNTYFIISTAGKFFYENMYPQYQEYWRYTPSDYRKFENFDISVNRIYTDGELDIYFIVGNNSKIG